MSETRLEIPLNRKKFLIRGSVFGLAALTGVWLFLTYAHQQTWMTPWVVQVIAGILTFIFGILATNDLQKVWATRSGWSLLRKALSIMPATWASA
ncbi:MAG: hypothetical protein IPJ06_14050 [Saprospiraceae bacterium]|nr:hypothetical protein [Saprospiraceae bacterium]